MFFLGQSWQKFLAHAPRPACSFRSAQAATLLEFHVPLTNCFVHMWRCVLHGPKPPLHRHNWLSLANSKTEFFLIHCPRHVSSRLPPSGETCKYATAPITQSWTDSLPIDMLLSALSVLVVAQSSSEVPEGLINYPVYIYIAKYFYNYNNFIFQWYVAVTPKGDTYWGPDKWRKLHSLEFWKFAGLTKYV